MGRRIVIFGGCPGLRTEPLARVSVAVYAESARAVSALRHRKGALSRSD